MQRKWLLILVVLCLFVTPTFAQDGGSGYTLQDSEGRLYAVNTEDPQTPPAPIASGQRLSADDLNDPSLSTAYFESSFVAPDTAIGDEFGRWLDVYDGTMIVGAKGENAAYIYTHNGTGWTYQTKLITSDGAGCGHSVTISSLAAAIGCTSGAVYVFEGSGASWSEVAKLEPPVDGDASYFGYSVDMDGTQLAVSTGSVYYPLTGDVAPYDAYVYTRSGTWSLSATLDPQSPAPIAANNAVVPPELASAIDYSSSESSALVTDPELDVTIGFSSGQIAINGNTVMIASNWHGDANEGGEVYVFTNNTGWSQTQTLTLGNFYHDLFGAAMAIQGDTAIIGAPYADVTTVYHLNGGTWQYVTEFFAKGQRIVYDGTLLAITSINDATANGWVDIYSGVGSNDIWWWIDTLNPQNADWFGSGVGIHGTEVVIGAPLDDVTANNAGRVHHYTTDAQIGRIYGTVRDRSNNPVPNIQVGFNAAGYGYVPVCTDANGEYELFNAPLNTDIRVHTETDSTACGGPDSGVVNFWNDTPYYWSATTFQLTDATPTATNIDLYWEQGGSVSGGFFDADTSQPINERMGIYVGDPTYNYIGFTYCNDDFGDTNYGDYIYKGIPFDTLVTLYPTSISCGNYTSDLTYTGVPPTLTLTAGTPTMTGVDFYFDHLATVSGTVYQSDTGNPQPYVRVWWLTSTYNNYYSNSVCTDANGNYSFGVQPNFSTRIYVANITQSNDCTNGTTGPYGQTFLGDTVFSANATLITPTSGQNLTLDINHARMGAVNATVDDGIDPVSDLVVWVRFYDSGSSAWGQNFYCVSSPGNFAAYAPYGFDFRVFIEATYDRCNQERTPYVTQYYGGNYMESSGTLLSVDSGTPTQNVAFSATMGAKITGNIYDATGTNPILYSSVYTRVNGDDFNYAWAYTGNSNTYEILGVPLSTPIEVYAQSYNYAYEWWQEAYSGLDAVMVNATVAGGSVTGIDFTLESTTTISGTVTDGVNPVEGVPVRIEGFSYTLCTGADGTYTVSNVAASGSYVVSAGGDYQYCTENGTYSKVYYNGVSDIGSATSVSGGASNVDFVVSIALTPDVNGDGIVSATDAIFVINRLGLTPTGGDAAADVDHDGDIDAADVQAVLDNLGTTP